jgi:hypothetical protein
MYSTIGDHSRWLPKIYRYKGYHLRNSWNRLVNRGHLRNETKRVRWQGSPKFPGLLPYLTPKVLRLIKDLCIWLKTHIKGYNSNRHIWPPMMSKLSKALTIETYLTLQISKHQRKCRYLQLKWLPTRPLNIRPSTLTLVEEAHIKIHREQMIKRTLITSTSLILPI